MFLYPFFFTNDLCNNLTEDEYPHIKANNVTSHHTHILYLALFYHSGLLLGYTLHGRVVNGHTAGLTCTRSSA